MANTYVDYTATAAQTDFAFNFNYLEDSHVVVEIDGIDKTLTTDYTIVTSPSKKVVLTSGATAGQLVRVKRVSDFGTDLVDFVNGSVLNEADLDKAYQHNRYLNEEAAEGNNDSMQTVGGGTDFNAESKKIVNLATPTLSTDAANKSYIDDRVALGSTNLNGFDKSTHTGDNTNTEFTLSFTSQTTTAEAYLVTIDGVVQTPTTAYSVNTTTNKIIFTSAPPTSASIVVVPIGTTSSASDATVTQAGTSTTKTLANWTNDLQSATATGSTTSRSFADRFNDVVNVLDYGADNTGATDSKTAIQAALNSGGKTVYVPAGTYKLDSNLSVPQGVSIKGEGQGSTIFDASSMDYTALPSNSDIIEVAEVTPVAIPALASNVSINDKEITLASSHTVSVGDIVLIYNPTDYSWHGSRSYYRAGEYLKVTAVTGNVLRFEGSIVDDYVIADVALYKVDMGYCSMTGFTLKCNPNAQGTLTSGLRLNHCRHSVVRDVEVITAPYTAISLSRCFDVTADNCRATDNFENEGNGEYGLAVWNCTYVTVKDCHLCSQRHGLTTGGGDGVGQVTNRFLNYVNNHVSTEGIAQALDLHGNSEYANVSNNMIDGGIDFGGDYINISNNTIYGKTVNGSAVYFIELKGANISVCGNTIKSNYDDLSRGNLIDCGGNSSPLNASTTRGGSILITDNNLIFDTPVDTVDDSEFAIIIIGNNGCNPTEELNCIIQNNTNNITSENVDPNNFVVEEFVMLRSYSGKPWDSVSIDNNVGSGGIRILEDGSGYACKKLNITNNNLKNGDTVYAEEVEEVVTCTGNTLIGFKGSGISLLGDSVNLIDTVRVSDNVIKDCFWGRTSSTETNATLRFSRIKSAYIANNFTTGDNKRIYLSTTSPNFTLGETVTGATSGATAIVYDKSADYILVKESITGTFVLNETITGGTSGLTATTNAASGPTYSKNYSQSFNTITNLWSGGNIDEAGIAEYKLSVTNDTSL